MRVCEGFWPVDASALSRASIGAIPCRHSLTVTDSMERAHQWKNAPKGVLICRVPSVLSRAFFG